MLVRTQLLRIPPVILLDEELLVPGKEEQYLFMLMYLSFHHDRRMSSIPMSG